MPASLELAVRWKDGRNVTVEVRVKPVLGKFRPDDAAPQDEHREAAESRVLALDDDELRSKTALLTFLARATRHQPDAGRVTVVCFEPDADRLLDLLGVTGPPKRPIVVELGDGG